MESFVIRLIGIAVVLEGDQVVIGRRRPETHLGDLLEFPGGKAYAGESPEAAALRELREETGLLARVERCLWVCEYDYGDRVVVLHFILCRRLAGELDPDRGYWWEPVSRLDPTHFPPANAEVIYMLQTGWAGHSCPA